MRDASCDFFSFMMLCRATWLEGGVRLTRPGPAKGTAEKPKFTAKGLSITHRLPFTSFPSEPESGATQALVGLSVWESALEWMSVTALLSA